MNRIRKGDLVRVISGKHKYAEGIVLKVFPKDDKALVEGVNKVKVHQKKDQNHDQSGIFEKELPIRLCKLALVEQKGKEKGSTTKVKYVINKDNKKVRLSKKTNAEILAGQK